MPLQTPAAGCRAGSRSHSRMRDHRPAGRRAARALLGVVILPAVAACAGGGDGPSGPLSLASGLDADALAARVTQFARAEIGADVARLEPWEREVLARLVEASDLMHEIFLRQVSVRNPAYRDGVRAMEGGAGEAARAYFDIMVGPWDRLEDNEPFLDVGPKPPGAGYYPPELTAPELEGWLQDHPEDLQTFTDYFHVIREEHGKLISIPYPREYQEWLEPAAALLREAAAIARPHSPSLARFLDTRATAFLSNDYFESDMAWMDIEGARIEPTIGPYEVYEDALMGYKAAFESFITLADPAASAELERLKDRLPELEASLPIEDRYRNPDRGFESPIRVVDVVYTAGDARAGVQTTAFNLPNDERVREAKGSKKVMLRNVSRAKFERVLAPIAEHTLASEQAGAVAFEPWFTKVLMHELAHGLGPGFIEDAGGARTTVNQALREHYSAIEEAKADVVGLHGLTVLAEGGVYDEAFMRQAFLSHVADLFRAVRFGASEAHGRANLVQFNWLVEQGAITAGDDGRFSADLATLVRANRALASRILTLQARGSYEDAAALLEQYGGAIPTALQTALERVGDVPVDIRPVYTAAETLRARD